jgi:diaminohydroxyphosphoribosylaminopyrimidine deaminase/5-amino-6-(5-phosphoribosylamino)uracil reductase
MLDPNPLVSGMGIQTLEAAGIEVTIGVLEEECRWLNRYFIKHITEKFPYVVAKYAQSFDGSIATSGGKSKWISCEESRRRAHILRSELDAVMIGKKTASADNPELTVRSVPGRNPYRIILDTNLSLPLSLKVFTDNYRANTFVCCKSDSDHLRKADVLRVAGVNLLPCDITNDGNIDLRYVFKTLYQEFNIATILVEGGSTLFSSLLKEDLIDEIQAFIAPKIFGSGVLPFRDFSAYNVDDAKNFQFVVASKSGTDLHLIAVRK